MLKKAKKNNFKDDISITFFPNFSTTVRNSKESYFYQMDSFSFHINSNLGDSRPTSTYTEGNGAILYKRVRGSCPLM